jgi:hypothetical protein
MRSRFILPTILVVVALLVGRGTGALARPARPTAFPTSFSDVMARFDPRRNFSTRGSQNPSVLPRATHRESLAEGNHTWASTGPMPS